MRPQLIMWLMIFLQQYCFALDLCHSVFDGRLLFSFMSKLFTLFFERFHVTRLTVPCLHPRPRTDACMCMWGQLLPKRGQLEWPFPLVGREICDFLAREDDHILDPVLYSYARMD
jgi:hypothetical protein